MYSYKAPEPPFAFKHENIWLKPYMDDSTIFWHPGNKTTPELCRIKNTAIPTNSKKKKKGKSNKKKKNTDKEELDHDDDDQKNSLPNDNNKNIYNWNNIPHQSPFDEDQYPFDEHQYLCDEDESPFDEDQCPSNCNNKNKNRTISIDDDVDDDKDDNVQLNRIMSMDDDDEDDDESEYYPLDAQHVSHNVRQNHPRRCKQQNKNNDDNKTQQQIIHEWMVCFLQISLCKYISNFNGINMEIYSNFMINILSPVKIQTFQP